MTSPSPLGNPELERHLAEAVEVARKAWPGLALSDRQFIRHLAERLPANLRGRSVEQSLKALHLSDLYLACACAAGVPGATDILEREYLAKVPSVLRRQRRRAETIEEVGQKLRESLLVQAQIATYTGEGKLWSWIEVIVKRMANKEERGRAVPTSNISRIAEGAGSSGNPEKDAIKKKLVDELQIAVRAAGSALSDEQRELLRFHYRNGMSETRLAKLFQTSQPTISRRLSKAKELILAETRRSLQERLNLAEQEFESFIGEIRSRWLDLSLSQVFGGTDGPDQAPS